MSLPTSSFITASILFLLFFDLLVSCVSSSTALFLLCSLLSCLIFSLSHFFPPIPYSLLQALQCSGPQARLFSAEESSLESQEELDKERDTERETSKLTQVSFATLNTLESFLEIWKRHKKCLPTKSECIPDLSNL